MLDYIYQWIENIAFYLVIVVVVIQMIPDNAYKKYIRFFAGMILILMLTGPILKMFGMTKLQNTEYQKALKEIELASEYMEELIGEEDVIGE